MLFLPLPVPVVNVFMHILELVLGVTVFPSLLRIASIRDNERILQKGQHLSFTSPLRILTGGVNPGRWTIAVTIYTIATVLLLEYSINEGSVLSTIQGDAIRYGRNDGVLRMGPQEVIYAARMCRLEFTNFSSTYRPFAMYSVDLNTSNLSNSVYSRMFNGSLFSCYGTTMGETLWTKGDRATITIATHSRQGCERNGSQMIASAVISGVRVCFKQGSRRYIDKAFELARNRANKALDPFVYINDVAIPSILWRSFPSREHRMVAEVHGGTKLELSCLALVIYIFVWVLVKFVVPNEWIYPEDNIGSEVQDLYSIVAALLTSRDNPWSWSQRIEGSFGTLYSYLDERKRIVFTRCEDTEWTLTGTDRSFSRRRKREPGAEATSTSTPFLS